MPLNMGVGGNEVHVGEHGKDSRGVWEKGNSQEVDWRLRHMGGSGTWEAEAGVRNGEPECGRL